MMILPLILQLLGIGLILVLAVGVLSPFESMGWWAGWSEENKPKLPQVEPLQDTPATTGPEISHYIVYLSGIGAIAGDFLIFSSARREDTVAAGKKAAVDNKAGRT